MPGVGIELELQRRRCIRRHICRGAPVGAQVEPLHLRRRDRVRRVVLLERRHGRARVLGIARAFEATGFNLGTFGHFLQTYVFQLVGIALTLGGVVHFARDPGPFAFDERNAIDVESMGLYWHFVDIVWIVIFTAVYLLEYIK